MNTCKFCGKPSSLLCDGRIFTLPSGKRFRVWMGFPNGKTTSCDAPVCRACAKKVSDVHYKLSKGGRWDTIDLCPDCQQVEKTPVEVQA